MKNSIYEGAGLVGDPDLKAVKAMKALERAGLIIYENSFVPNTVFDGRMKK